MSGGQDKIPIVLSLGAGVQSSCLALMAANGKLGQMPIAAVFADTGDEPKSVYKWLEYLGTQLPFPVYRVRRTFRDGRIASLSDEAIRMRVSAKGSKFSQTSLPLFTLNSDGSHGMVTHRSCTADFKIAPIMKFVRKLCKVKRGETNVVVHQWIGISLDELRRAKSSRDAWAKNVYPLIERRMTRQACLHWIETNGYPTPPRSACVFCPFHSDAEWRRLKLYEPDEFSKAVQFERDIQSAKKRSDNFDSIPFLHSSRKPLDEVDFKNDFDRGQLSLWDDECEGMCGV